MKAGETKLQNLLEGSKQYVIPLFQRQYTWGIKQWKTLWNDILELYKDPNIKDHFMASIVTMPTKSKPEGVPKYLVIDGQQRLTTFYILLAILRDLKTTDENFVFEIETYYLFNKTKTQNDYYKLLPTQQENDRNNLFNIMRRQNTINIGVSNHQMIKAYDYFNTKIQEDISDFEKLKDIIISKISIVSITLDKEDDPYRIFESLNGKGAPLTQSDLIRNYFLMRIDINKQEEIYNTHWKNMENNLNKFDKEGEKGKTLSTFIRHFLMKEGKEIKENEIYYSLKEIADKIVDEDIIEYINCLTQYSQYYSKFLDPNGETNIKVQNCLNRLKRLDINTSFPFLLNIYNLYDENKISTDILIQILNIIENFIVRRFICKVPTNQLNKIFPSLFENIDKNDIVESLKNFLREKNYPKDKKLKDNFHSMDIYHSGRIDKCKFILDSIEVSFLHKESIDLNTLTIEHIMPQTINDAWKKYLGDNWEDIYDTHLHTIGNLTLTAYNSELSNELYDFKKIEFKKSNLELNKYFENIEKWNETEIINRAKILSEKAITIWPSFWGETDKDEILEGVNLDISDNNVTGTRPTSLFIYGQKFNVDAWSEVLIKTVETLLELDEERFNSFIQDYPTRFTKDASTLNKPYKLNNGFFMEKISSSESIKKFCINLVKFFELESKEWHVNYQS